MEREYVKSSMIRSFGFENSTLEIEFNSGAVWQYFDVPESVYYAMKAASSCGKFFHTNIKRQYPESQVG